MHFAGRDGKGRIVFAGTAAKWPGLLPSGNSGPESSNVVARLAPDGSFDESYDGDGVAVNPDEFLPAIPYGDLVAAPAPGGGTIYLQENDPYIGGARLARAGSAGKEFSERVAGVGPNADLSLGTPWELAVHPRYGIYGFGRFYAGEESGDIVYVLFRHRLGDGKPDRTFGGRGVLEPRPPGARNRYWAAYDFELQPDGKALVAGVVERRGRARVFAARYTASGEPDPTFGAGGFAELDLARGGGDDRDWLAAVGVADGGIFLTGWIRDRGTTVFRLREDGSLDKSFGTNGRVAVPRL